MATTVRARKTYIVFIDEAGFMLSPVVRRTWAPRGQTPVIKLSRPHDRISVIGAITIRRKDRRFGFHFQLSHDNANFRGHSVVAFVENLRRKVRSPITVIWDQISIHWGQPVKDYLATHQTVVAEPLPPYAPELNPVDLVWSYVKYGRLANYCPRDVIELRHRLIDELSKVKRKPKLLEGFFRHTGLSLDP